MKLDFRERLHDYYFLMGIHPLDFQCSRQSICRAQAFQGNMTEAKMSMVGSQYGQNYPKIVVVSLDPPGGGPILGPEQRTSEHVALWHESENYSINRPNTHWAMTQIIVKDILTIWGYQAQVGVAVVLESYSGRPIENVSAYFAHVNISKCSMNNPGQRQSPEEVHQVCSRSYLYKELVILEPEIFLTQGADTNRILGRMLIGKPIIESDLPKSLRFQLGTKQVLWLPMPHPTQQVKKIRDQWPAYLEFIKEWSQNRMDTV